MFACHCQRLQELPYLWQPHDFIQAQSPLRVSHIQDWWRWPCKGQDILNQDSTTLMGHFSSRAPCKSTEAVIRPASQMNLSLGPIKLPSVSSKVSTPVNLLNNIQPPKCHLSVWILWEATCGNGQVFSYEIMTPKQRPEGWLCTCHKETCKIVLPGTETILWNTL